MDCCYRGDELKKQKQVDRNMVAEGRAGCGLLACRVQHRGSESSPVALGCKGLTMCPATLLDTHRGRQELVWDSRGQQQQLS